MFASDLKENGIEKTRLKWRAVASAANRIAGIH